MKFRIMMATLVVTLLMGARIYASDCDPCEAIDACGDTHKSCDLFAGLKKLVKNCTPCDQAADCGAEGVVACSPCEEAAAADPCGEVNCDDFCKGHRFTFGKRLRSFFSIKPVCNPCDEAADCDPCGEAADNADCGGCDDGCGNDCAFEYRPFSLRRFIKRISLAGRCNDGCTDPCGEAGDCGTTDDCSPCESSCDGYRPIRLGRLVDLPRRSLKRFFDGFRVGSCETGCNPCDPACDDPCGSITTDSAVPATGK
ncbi:MAG: hypothetical protein LBC74_08715 [Planctomycetaceae bacterium]|nr:hypothetical protein [Planctomycetaceae bacterium]